MNVDGIVNALDGLATAQYLGGILPPLANFFQEVADVNCDGALTLDDANLMAGGGPFSC